LATKIYILSGKTELPIVIDTGASNSITPIPTDFVNGIIHKADLQSLTQVNGTTPVCGQGPVQWPIEDVVGTRRTITTDAYYVPDAGIRLFSPQDLEGVLTNGDLLPGDKISCNQYMSSSKGRLLHTKGPESSSKQYVGGTIFIDHATNFLFTNHRINLTASSTVESKHQCESKFDEFGIRIKQYAADNHPFPSKAWVDDCAVQRQLPTKHSGVGAHHQILAERQIQTTFNWSRANLLHFVLHWPKMARNRDYLWPFAINYAVYMHNHLPIQDKRLSPSELFTGTVFNNYNHLIRAHVFCCPVYVLDPQLQDAKKIPKWSV
jgi:hypothetical protein